MPEAKLPFPIPFPQAPMAAGAPQLPKISQLIKPFADIEAKVNESISAATGITPPPGPNSVLLAIASSIEENIGQPGGETGGQAGGSAGTATIATIEVPAGEAKVESLVASTGGEAEAEKVAQEKEIGNEVPANPVLRIY